MEATPNLESIQQQQLQQQLQQQQQQRQEPPSSGNADAMLREGSSLSADDQLQVQMAPGPSQALTYDSKQSSTGLKNPFLGTPKGQEDTATFFEKTAVKWIIDRVTSSLKGSVHNQKAIKKWKSGVDNPECVRALDTFIRGGEMICFYDDIETETLKMLVGTCNTEHPQKTVIFWRTSQARDGSLTKEPDVYVTNFLPDRLANFRIEMESIFIPYMLAGSKSAVTWPKVVQHDVIRQAQKFSGILQHFEGLIKGTVILPLPPDMPVLKAEVSSTAKDKKRRSIHIQETAIVEWSRHIRSVLAEESSTTLEMLEARGIFPGASEELKFWQKKHDKLRHIVRQLSSPKVRVVITELTKVHSAYVMSFDSLMDDLDVALVESSDVTMHLCTLRKPLHALETAEFHDIPGALPAVFHIISLLWFTSAHYDIRRLKVLFRMLSNTVVSAVTKFLTASDLFSDTAGTVLQKLQDSLAVASKFKDTFFSYRIQANAQPGKSWTIEESSVFLRVDKIIQRIRDLVEVFEIKSRFSRLKDFEPGGDRGNELQEVVGHVYAEFQRETLSWSNIVAGIVDPSSSAFEESYAKFISNVEQLDDRIAMVVGKCFRERETYQSLKLLDSMKEWNSTAISVEKESRLQELLTVLRREVEVLFHRFESEKHLWGEIEAGVAPLPNHLPWRTSLCIWVNSLLDRVKFQVQYLQLLSRRVFKSPEGVSVLNHARIFEETLNAWRESKLSVWKTQVTSLCLDRLDNTLLRRLGGSGLLVVNFDKNLAQALEDVWAIQCFGVDLGHKVKSVFGQRDEFRSTIARLEVVAAQYNHIVDSVIEVERPLVRKSLDAIHTVLNEGLVELTWRSPRTNEFVERISKAVSTLHGNMMFLKGNVSTVIKILKNWKNMHKVIHFSEEESWESRKKSILNELTELWQGESSHGLTDSEKCARKWVRKWRERVSVRLHSLDDILKQYKRIRRLVESGRSLLNVDANSPAWGAYLDHINNLFTTLFVSSVKKSLEHLLRYLEVVRTLDTYGRSLEPSQTLETPRTESRLMAIKLVLRDHEAEFDPSINRDDYGSVQYRVYEWCNSVFEVGRQLPRLDDPSNHYYVLLFDHPELNLLKDEILRLMLSTIQKLEAVRMDFMKYSYLWQEDIESYVERFAEGNLATRSGANGRVSAEPFEDAVMESDDEDEQEIDFGFADEEEKEDCRASEEGTAPTNKPTIAEFEAQIIKYEHLSEEICQLPSEVHYGWIVLDTSHLKSELVRLSHEWRSKFLNYQKKRVISNLSRFKQFVQTTENGISVSSSNDVDSYSELVKVMKHLARFHSHADQFDKMYEPSKNVVVLLKKHDIHVPGSVLQDVENSPVLWRDLKKKCFMVNELLSVRQMEEVAKIRLVEHNFEKRSQLFYRNSFQKKEPTSLSVPPRLAYKSLSELHVMVLNLEYQLKDLREKQQLFQLMPSPGRAVRSCRTDLMLLKYLWDSTAYASYQMEAWNHVPCTLVNIAEMSERVTRLVTMIKGLDKRVRRWDVYHQIEAKAKNFLVSLPLIESLRTPAMRVIHWEELMIKTGVHFDFKDLTIENLISLNLHKFPEEVSNIVGKASRQAEIEEQLSSLESAWKNVSLVFDTNTGLDYPSFTVPTEVQVTIEEHQLLLQSLAQRKFVSEYLTNVQQWQKTLATVEGVLAMFVEVQKTWRYLMTIFIGSDDIKSQLPQHTQLFLEIDAQVKALLREASRSPVIVPLCCNEGRELALSTLQNQLAQCERALEGYMDQKRKTYPRFYFVSTPNLLEILSKTGKDPRQIMTHIPRVMQDVLSFGLDGFLAVNVHGKGGETFDLATSVLCSGRVEHWFQACADSVASTIFTLIEQALLSYSGRSRLQWIEQNISQVILVTSHIHWTVDVSSTFHAMEEGNEAALKEQHRRYQDYLQELVSFVPSEALDGVTRRKLVNMVIQALHQADVIQQLIDKKADNKNAFSWQSQLRHRLNEKARGVVAEICECHFNYGGEYHSEAMRLVITPLTERIYITLAQSLRLKTGGAPTGPAGTGKTETVKDLAKQLGHACYIFNCSELMTFKTLGSVFKGLASSGTWGCFDEFNRIRLPVLSVVSLQFKRLFDAQKQNLKEFSLGADEVSLDASCSIFVTMNLGYLGRGELPGNLKAMFRPVTVACPDLPVICECLLLTEGFKEVKTLSRKLTRLFTLCSDLLSVQTHYYWGLRTIKPLLSVAGAMKRARCVLDEEALLMQVLRDYTLPKVISSDIDAFHALLSDVFPGRIVPTNKRAEDFDACLKKACSTNGLQPEEGLLVKCQQLHELIRLRHCVMVLGKPATGKSTCRHVLMEAYKQQGQKYVIQVINPKSITTAELFGSIEGKDWVDGLASGIIRACAALPPTESSCVVFDGDLDTAWIESMNTAMDENKVLTLASNDRVQIPDGMKLVFEITSLEFATPATVSRAGILYISTTDVGWLPHLQSWFDKKKMASTITPLLDKYVQRCIDWVMKEGVTCLPQTEFSLVRQLCAYVDLLLKKEQTASGVGNEREAEHWFVFACIWAFGGTLTTEGSQRLRFDRWWRHEWKILKFPESGTVFDYFISPESKKLEKWADTVKKSLLATQATPYSFIPTAGTATIQFFFDKLIATQQPVLLCGGDATGKTMLVRDRMKALPEATTFHYISFSYSTTSAVLQTQLQQKLERKMGRRWGPVGSKNLVWVLDDVNTPAPDKYNTQTAIELLRQFLDYSTWYQKVRWQPIAISDVQLLALYNPTIGSAKVNPRFQRHFVNLQMPATTRENASQVFTKLLMDSLGRCGYDRGLKLVEKLVTATLDIHDTIKKDLPKTAAKFHYSVNFRHLSHVFVGMTNGLSPIANAHPSPPALGASHQSVMTKEAQASVAKLWLHEVQRAYTDRLMDAKDVSASRIIIKRTLDQHFVQEHFYESLTTQRLLFCNFSEDKKDCRDSVQVDTVTDLVKMITALREDDSEIVLFEEAAEHVLRACRVLEKPSGHLAFIGVGGCGKQAISRLAAAIINKAVVTPRVTGNVVSAAKAPLSPRSPVLYKEKPLQQTPFREDLKAFFIRTGVRAEGAVLLLPECNLRRDDVLSDVSTVLSGGDVSEYFTAEEREDVIRKVRPDVRQALVVDTADNCWAFFLDRAQQCLRLILCLHPGESARIRCRKFPALLSCTVQNYFHPWDYSALLAVGEKRLRKHDLGIAKASTEGGPQKSAISPAKREGTGPTPPARDRHERGGRIGRRNVQSSSHKEGKQKGEDKRDKKEVLSKTEGEVLQECVVKTMARIHVEAEKVAIEYTRRTGVNLHVTCRTFSDFIKCYIELLGHKQRLVDQKKRRLDDGLTQLKRSSTDTISLSEVLAKKQQQVIDRKTQVDDLVQRLIQEKQVVASENAKAVAEEAKAAEIQKLVAVKSAEMDEDLSKADPLVLNANRALDALNKNNVLELKNMKVPAPEVQNVLACVIILLSPPQLVRDKSWSAAQKLMLRVDAFLQSLRNYKKEHIPETHIAQLRPYLSSPDFTGEVVTPKSTPAGFLCEWVRNVVKYYELYCYVQPKRESVQEGKLRLEEASIRVLKIKAHVEKIQAKFVELEAAVSEAQVERDAVVEQEAQLVARLGLSQRLVSALDTEQTRWGEEVRDLTENRKNLAGDVLIAAALVSYAGPLAAENRTCLLASWANALRASTLPHTEAGLDPLNTLVTPAVLAEWANQGLPRDATSIQNACICTYSRRPVLLVDPQFQGHAWLKKVMEAEPDEAEEEGDQPKRRVRMQVKVENTERQRTIRHVVFAREDDSLKQTLIQALTQGETLMVEQISGETCSLLRTVAKNAVKGSLLTLEDRDVVCHPDFRLILHTKQAVPTVKDDQAYLCLVNFAVPPEGIEEQLLSLVVNKQKAELELKREEVLFATNKNQIRMAELQDGLLKKISEAGDNLVDKTLVETLEHMKKTTRTLSTEVQSANTKESNLDETREHYRPVARRGALIYLILSDMEKLEWLYQYSLRSFSILFLRAIESVNYDAFEENDQNAPQEREDINILVSEMTLCIARHIKRGTLPNHRQAFELSLCLAVMEDAGMLRAEERKFLLNWSVKPAKGTNPPASWLTQEQWDNLCCLAECGRFADLHVDVEKRLKRWRDWATSEKPEEERLPGDARYLGPFEKMLIVKVLRPDRLGVAAEAFCQDLLGEAFVHSPVVSLMETVRDTSPITPVLFILHQGSDPLKDIENLAHKMGLSEMSGNLRTIALGEGQEEEATDGLRTFAATGGWIVFANIHLMRDWMNSFEAMFADVLKQAHRDFRVFFTAEPSTSPETRLPRGLVQSSIKCLSTEGALSVQASMQKAWTCFSSEQMESSLKCSEHKRLLFALCYFHSAVVCRKRFGDHGWSKPYAFSTSDLLISSQILSNYLDPNSSNIPWEDLRYILGEVMYGGHVTDQWDSRTLKALLQTILNDEFLLTGKLAPGLVCPPSGAYQQYALFIENSFPPESPALLHMHPNGEMSNLTRLSEDMISSLLVLCTTKAEVAQEEVGGGGGSSAGGPAVPTPPHAQATVASQLAEEMLKHHKMESNLRERLEDLLSRLPQPFNTADCVRNTPVSVFVVQELERLNQLLNCVNATLSNCLLGLKGMIAVSESLETVLDSVENNRVPEVFRSRANSGMKHLSNWYADLLKRFAHLDEWAAHLTLPVCVWISGLFNPRGFLSVVLQISARKTGVPIDELKFTTDVVKKTKEDLTSVPREGAFIYGLYLEGAGWNSVAVCKFFFFGLHGWGSTPVQLVIVPKELYFFFFFTESKCIHRAT